LAQKKYTRATRSGTEPIPSLHVWRQTVLSWYRRRNLHPIRVLSRTAVTNRFPRCALHGDHGTRTGVDNRPTG